MTIADACFDFLHFDTDRTSWKEATERLLESIEWYGGPGAGPIFGYPPEHIDALRTATEAALSHPDDPRFWRRLRVLAEHVREHYDGGLVRDEVLDFVLDDLVAKLARERDADRVQRIADQADQQFDEDSEPWVADAADRSDRNA